MLAKVLKFAHEPPLWKFDWNQDCHCHHRVTLPLLCAEGVLRGKEKGGITIKNWGIAQSLEASIGCGLHVKITVTCGLAIKGLRFL